MQSKKCNTVGPKKNVMSKTRKKQILANLYSENYMLTPI